MDADSGDPAPSALALQALDGLKFAACVPKDLALEMLRSRLADPKGVEAVIDLDEEQAY